MTQNRIEAGPKKSPRQDMAVANEYGADVDGITMRCGQLA